MSMILSDALANPSPRTASGIRYTPRGIDAPEVDSSTGQEAKKFLENCFRKSNAIVLTTFKSDKYDRYLADVFQGDTYINQRLLDEGLATTAID